MPRPGRFFPPEYKAEVVELICTTGKTVGQVARELDLTETAVREWVKRAGLTTAERDELRRLPREVLSCVRSVRSCARPRCSSPGRPVTVSCYRLIDAEKAHHPVSRLCRVLGVARAGYHVSWQQIRALQASHGPRTVLVRRTGRSRARQQIGALLRQTNAASQLARDGSIVHAAVGWPQQGTRTRKVHGGDRSPCPAQ
jgi:hypothetical protein